MSTPAIGKMRYRVTLQQPARTPDGGGGATVAWFNVSDLWAALNGTHHTRNLGPVSIGSRPAHAVHARHACL
jgi:head-tail adaptor